MAVSTSNQKFAAGLKELRPTWRSQIGLRAKGGY